jgi:hypothetical protein
MKTATLVRAYGKAHRNLGWYEGCYGVSIAALKQGDPQLRREKQADKFEAEILRRIEAGETAIELEKHWGESF